MHLKLCIVSAALVVASSVVASSAGDRYNKNDPQCMSGGIAEDGSPLPMGSDNWTQDFELKSENSRLKDDNATLISNNRDLTSESERLKSRWFWPWILLSFVVGGVSGFVIDRVARQSQAQNVAIQTHLDADLPKCPRCGLWHDPNDTVCKNPNCRTQF